MKMIIEKELIGDYYSAPAFMEEMGYTLGFFKSIFLKTQEDKENYQKFLTKNNRYDSKISLFNFLIEIMSYTDDEVICDSIEEMDGTYSVDFVDSDRSCDEEFWRINKFEFKEIDEIKLELTKREIRLIKISIETLIDTLKGKDLAKYGPDFYKIINKLEVKK